MIIRKLEEKERLEAYKLAVFCFHQRVENIEEESKKYISNTKEDWGAFEDCNNSDSKNSPSLMARITNNHYKFYVDGKSVNAGGIGEVATLPEYRETGAIRAIFNKLLPDAYKNGEIISTLYPFNHKFYRKFGYEVIPFKNEYIFSPKILTDYRFLDQSNGKYIIHKWQPNQNIQDFLNIYNTFSKQFNLCAERTKEMMLKHMKTQKEYVDRKFSYLFMVDNTPVSYMIFTDTSDSTGNILKIDECAWTCRQGFNAILNFLSRFSADYTYINLPLPKGIDLIKIISTPDAYKITKKTCQSFMARIVNAKTLLEIIKKPSDCNFTIKITDDLIKENNLLLCVKNQSVQVLEETTDILNKIDIQTDIRALAQLALGCTNLDEAMLRNDITVNSNKEMIRQCFTEKLIFVSEAF